MRGRRFLVALMGFSLRLQGQTSLKVLPEKLVIEDHDPQLFGWKTMKNPYTNMPRYAYGKPLAIEGRSYKDKALVVAQKMDISLSDLQYKGTFTTRSGKTYVNFVQVVN